MRRRKKIWGLVKSVFASGRRPEFQPQLQGCLSVFHGTAEQAKQKPEELGEFKGTK